MPDVDVQTERVVSTGAEGCAHPTDQKDDMRPAVYGPVAGPNGLPPRASADLISGPARTGEGDRGHPPLGETSPRRIALVLTLSSALLLGLITAVALRLVFGGYPYAIYLVRGQFDQTLPHEKAIRRLPDITIRPGDEIQVITRFTPYRSEIHTPAPPPTSPLPPLPSDERSPFDLTPTDAPPKVQSPPAAAPKPQPSPQPGPGDGRPEPGPKAAAAPPPRPAGDDSLLPPLAKEDVPRPSRPRRPYRRGSRSPP